jgi:hypothetical protein
MRARLRDAGGRGCVLEVVRIEPGSGARPPGVMAVALIPGALGSSVGRLARALPAIGPDRGPGEVIGHRDRLHGDGRETPLGLDVAGASASAEGVCVVPSARRVARSPIAMRSALQNSPTCAYRAVGLTASVRSNTASTSSETRAPRARGVGRRAGLLAAYAIWRKSSPSSARRPTMHSTTTRRQREHVGPGAGGPVRARELLRRSVRSG